MKQERLLIRRTSASWLGVILSGSLAFNLWEVYVGLDYSKGCVNFRDVGLWVNQIARKTLLPEQQLFRGGKLDSVKDAKEIENPRTIICLRKGIDPHHVRFGAEFRHFPISNHYEKYETGQKEVRRWLQDIFLSLATDVTRYPVLFYCTSGKDRTGVVITCLLHILGIERQIIVEEYLLSDGEVKREWIETALDGLENTNDYFQRIDLETLKKQFLPNADG